MKWFYIRCWTFNLLLVWYASGVPKKIGAAPLGPPLTLRNYMLQRARQHTVICIIGRRAINFSKKSISKAIKMPQPQRYSSWISTYSFFFEQYHLLVAIQVYSCSDKSIICFAKIIACASSRNKFRNVPILSPYSRTHTISDSFLASNSCQFFFHIRWWCLRGGSVPGGNERRRAPGPARNPGSHHTQRMPAVDYHAPELAIILFNIHAKFSLGGNGPW